MWTDRLAREVRRCRARVIEVDGGRQMWTFEGRLHPTIGLNAVAGKDPKDFGVDPVRFDEMLPGCYDVAARVRDMDLDGVHTQMCFPSFPGFAGSTLLGADDKGLATACVSAWNDFILDEWCAYEAGRFIPMVLIPFWDVAASVAEIQRVAAKGAKAISFTESPHGIGLPSYPLRPLGSDARRGPRRRPAAVPPLRQRRRPPFAPDAPFAVGDRVVRHQRAVRDRRSPALAGVPQVPAPACRPLEGGIGWLPYVLERTDYTWERHRWYTGVNTEVRPSDLFRDHIFGCFIVDDAGLAMRDLIGVDSIMFEGDYPHSDSNFPATRKTLEHSLAGVPDEQARQIAEDNARRVFNFPRVP